MRSSKGLKILFVGEGLERFTPQIEALKNKFDFFIEDSKECLKASLKIKDLSLIVFQKRVIEDYCVNCIKEIKGLKPQTVIIVLCEKIPKKTISTLFRYGVRDILEQPFNKQINLSEVITKLYFIFNMPKNRERRYNYLTLKYIKKFEPLSELLSIDNRIEKAKIYMDENFKNHIGLKEIAREAGMSKFHFCRTFKRKENISFKRYLTNVRIEKAKDLLKDKNTSIAEVALEVGFQSLSHFTTLFKSHSNISPGAFRKIVLKALFYTFCYHCFEHAAILLL